MEASVGGKQNGGEYRVAGLCTKLMYLQGLWWDPPELDLEFLRQLFGPRFARLLYDHKSFRQTLWLLRTLYMAFFLGSLASQTLLLFPVGMVVFWDNKVDVLCNCYANIVTLVLLTGGLTFLLQKARVHGLLGDINRLADPTLVDDERQRALLRQTHRFCHHLAKYLHLVVCPVVAIAMGFVCLYLLPRRKTIIREWYPFNQEESPVYELLLIWRCLEVALLNSTAITLITYITSMLLYVKALFSVLITKITNIGNREARQRRRRVFGVTASNKATLLGDNNGRAGELSCLEKSRYGDTHHLSHGRPRPVLRGGRHTRVLGPPLYRVGVGGPPRSLAATWRPSLKHALDRSKYLVHRPDETMRTTLRRIALQDGTSTHLQMAKRHPKCWSTYRVSKGRSQMKTLRLLDCCVGVQDVGRDRKMQRELVEVAKYHAEVLRIVKEIDQIASAYFTVMYFVNTIALAVTVLFFTTVDDVGANEFIFLIFSVEIMALYVMHNYMGSVISAQGQEVGEAIYNIDWLGASETVKKSALIIMARANRPVHFKPPGLDPLSLKLFGDVTIRAYKMLSTINSFMK